MVLFGHFLVFCCFVSPAYSAAGPCSFKGLYDYSLMCYSYDSKDISANRPSSSDYPCTHTWSADRDLCNSDGVTVSFISVNLPRSTDCIKVYDHSTTSYPAKRICCGPATSCSTTHSNTGYMTVKFEGYSSYSSSFVGTFSNSGSLDSDFSGGTIAGIAAGCICFIAFLIAVPIIIACLVRRRRTVVYSQSAPVVYQVGAAGYQQQPVPYGYSAQVQPVYPQAPPQYTAQPVGGVSNPTFQ